MTSPTTTPSDRPRKTPAAKKAPAAQTMKPATAAKKLGVYLGATPAEFQEGVVSREELNAMQADPPEWLRDLRREGPHPPSVAAGRLGVSIAGLLRGGITEPLTTAQIEALKAEPPEWLHQERATQSEVRRETARVREAHQAKAEAREAREEQELRSAKSSLAAGAYPGRGARPVRKGPAPRRGR